MPKRDASAREPGETDEAYVVRMARLESQREYMREYRAKNREALKEKQRARYAALPEEVKAARIARQRERDKERTADPDWREKHRERERLRYQQSAELRDRIRAQHLALRSPPADHPGTCDCCGCEVKPRRNGKTGLNQEHRHDTGEIRGWTCHRCNMQVAVLDLRFTDPDRFAALLAWSNRGAPVVRVPVVKPDRRRIPFGQPALFDEE